MSVKRYVNVLHSRPEVLFKSDTNVFISIKCNSMGEIIFLKSYI